jgi:16S rRNA (cytidine1402-2'-O)-methyltransferase
LTSPSRDIDTEPAAADDTEPAAADSAEPRRATGLSKLASGLYLVATPIGNLGDLPPRAVAVLAAVDTVLCEDTRHSGRLMAHLGLKVRLKPYHEHNAAKVRPGLIEALAQGATIALISDAGMPAIADPGMKLVKDAIEAGILVSAVPGPSAGIMALAISGLPTDRYFFQGFLPAKASARRKVLAEIAPVPATLVLFESPNRLAKCLADAVEILGLRPAAIARELTKLHEEVRRGTLEALAAAFAREPAPKGEIVVVIGPPGDAVAAFDKADIDALLLDALAEHGASRAAALVAEATGRPRGPLYRRLLELQGQR